MTNVNAGIITYNTCGYRSIYDQYTLKLSYSIFQVIYTYFINTRAQRITLQFIKNNAQRTQQLFKSRNFHQTILKVDDNSIQTLNIQKFECCI